MTLSLALSRDETTPLNCNQGFSLHPSRSRSSKCVSAARWLEDSYPADSRWVARSLTDPIEFGKARRVLRCFSLAGNSARVSSSALKYPGISAFACALSKQLNSEVVLLENFRFFLSNHDASRHLMRRSFENRFGSVRESAASPERSRSRLCDCIPSPMFDSSDHPSHQTIRARNDDGGNVDICPSAESRSPLEPRRTLWLMNVCLLNA